MKKLKRHIIHSILLLVALVSCTSTKNTSATRWYHSFNTRYNVYFNGSEAFNEAFKAQNEKYEESYSELIYMYPISATNKEKGQTGGPYDKAIEKAVKAIKTHSIKTKPKKESGKKSDPKHQEFMKREEYNPFMHNAWMMLGKSQFYNSDFLTASSTFSYISRHYMLQPQVSVPAKIWQARSYSEMGWLYEADDILSKINNANLPKSESNWFSSVYADYLIKNKQYAESIPYLITAIDAEKNKTQRSRMRYLLGQLYTIQGQKELAYKAFGDAAKSNPPYKLEFNAKIRQTEVYPGGNINKVTNSLRKMAKSRKNKELLDQVYYALGNVYMSVPDTAKAIESYSLGVEKSTQNQLDKALCQIKLGDIYFQQRNYIKAQPCYSDALGQLKKEHPEYTKVSKRSEVLDELVVHAEAVYLQDSLQTLARMPEAERMAVIDKIIESVIKKEKEEKEKAEREESLARQELIKDNARSPMGMPQPSVVNTALRTTEKNSFYFYNEQTVATGKSSFQQKWGRRKLEDDWRRKSKISIEEDDMASSGIDVPATSDQQLTDESGNLIAADDTTSGDPIDELKDPKFYLQQIPLTEEDIEASNLIIADGLFNMGVIFKDKLEDYTLAIESFNKLETRFPDNEYKLEEYYHMYLMYLKMENMEMVNVYKSKIRNEFPESELAIAMADPNYEYNMRMMDLVQDSIYEKTYEAYLESDASTIRKNYETASTKYAQSKLIPKFMFLNALSFVQTNEPDTFKVRLKELVEKYPEADVSVLAEEIMKRIKQGMTLSGDGNMVRGGLFNLRFGVQSDSLVIDSTIVFSAEKMAPHLLMLIFPAGTADKNILLYNVAEFNFSSFMVNDFDLQFENVGDISMLQIKGFNNYDEITQYCKMIQRPEGFANKLEPSVVVIPISTDNLSTLMKGKSLEEYTTFFAEHFGNDHPQLIEKWKLKQEKDSIEGQPNEKELDIPSDTENETKTEEGTITETIDLTTKKIEVEATETDTTMPAHKQIKPVSTDAEPEDSTAVTPEEVVDKATDAAESASKSLDDVSETIDEISKDPIRGLKKLFSKDKEANAIDDYVKQQEQEEKEKQKQLKKEQQDKEKEDRKLLKQQQVEKKEVLKKQKQDEKALMDEKAKRENDLKELKKQEEKQKVQETNRIKDEREAAKKQKEDDRKAKEKQRREERSAKEKAAKEKRKLKEEQRKIDQKKKEEALKEKKRLREEATKQKKNKE